MISTRPGLAGTERRGGPRAEPLRLVPGLVCVSARWRITARSNANRDPDRVHRTRVGTNQAVVLISPLEKPGRKRPGLKGARWRAPRLPGSSLVRAGKAELGFSNRGSAPWSLAFRASAIFVGARQLVRGHRPAGAALSGKRGRHTPALAHQLASARPDCQAPEAGEGRDRATFSHRCQSQVEAAPRYRFRLCEEMARGQEGPQRRGLGHGP